MPHDYGKLANQELRNLIANASRLQREDVMAAALREFVVALPPAVIIGG